MILLTVSDQHDHYYQMKDYNLKMKPEDMKRRFSHMRPQENKTKEMRKWFPGRVWPTETEKYFLPMNIVKKLFLYTSQWIYCLAPC